MCLRSLQTQGGDFDSPIPSTTPICSHFRDGWATLTGKHNAGLSFNIDRDNWVCATSRAFREVACSAADTVRLRLSDTAHTTGTKTWK